MSLSLEDVYRIANLSELEISEQAARSMQSELNAIFKMIEEIRAVDTTGVEPMPHPHDGVQRLREDVVSEVIDRQANMQNAPEQLDGYFLVPQVVE